MRKVYWCSFRNGLTSAFKESGRYGFVIDQVLTVEEQKAADASAITAFYTYSMLIIANWRVVERFGFTVGHI